MARFDAGSAVLPGISEGWPGLMSDLRPLLERGSHPGRMIPPGELPLAGPAV